MSVVVVATISPADGQRDAVIEVFERAIADVHSEDGCELYALNVGSDRLVMVEKWTSRAALDAHSAGPVLKRLGGELVGLIASPPDVQVLEPHPAGHAELGVV